MTVVPVFDLVRPILNCEQLLHKPKIFICQTCRGDYAEEQGLLDNVHDPVENRYYHAGKDAIFIYSSIVGNPSFRARTGPARMIELFGKYIRLYGNTLG